MIPQNILSKIPRACWVKFFFIPFQDISLAELHSRKNYYQTPLQ